MALLTTYTNTNKATSIGLAVRYTVEFVDYAYYRVTRTATKSYSYRGMTRAAAEACRTAKVAQYTNLQASLKFTTGVAVPTIVTNTVCQASISARRDHGDSWRCEISVNETDIRASATAPTDLATMFASENARNYDESGAQSLTLSSVTVGEHLLASFSANIPQLDPSRLVLQFKATSTAESWTVTPAVYHAASGKLYIEDATGYAAGQYFRLCYGSVNSAVVISTAES